MYGLALTAVYAAVDDDGVPGSSSQAVTGSLTFGGTLTRSVTRAVDGATTPSGTATRQSARALAAAIAPAGGLVKRTDRTLSGSTPPSGALASLRTFLRTVAGAIAPSGTVARTGFGRALAAALTPSGALAKRTSRALAGETTPTGTAARLTFRVVGGTLAPTGLLAKRPTRSLSGGLTLSGTVVPIYSVAVSVLELTFTPEVGPAYVVPFSLAPRYTLAEVTFAPSLTMSSVTPNKIPLSVDSLIRLQGVKVWDPTSGLRILATGITIGARIAATPTGAAIDASLALTLTERAAGDFHATVQGNNTETFLRAYLGQLVYLVLTIGANDFLGHYPIRVVDGVRVGV